jgi:hypothetical protein
MQSLIDRYKGEGLNSIQQYERLKGNPRTKEMVESLGAKVMKPWLENGKLATDKIGESKALLDAGMFSEDLFTIKKNNPGYESRLKAVQELIKNSSDDDTRALNAEEVVSSLGKTDDRAVLEEDLAKQKKIATTTWLEWIRDSRFGKTMQVLNKYGTIGGWATQAYDYFFPEKEKAAEPSKEDNEFEEKLKGLPENQRELMREYRKDSNLPGRELNRRLNPKNKDDLRIPGSTAGKQESGLSDIITVLRDIRTNTSQKVSR